MHSYFPPELVLLLKKYGMQKPGLMERLPYRVNHNATIQSVLLQRRTRVIAHRVIKNNFIAFVTENFPLFLEKKNGHALIR